MVNLHITIMRVFGLWLPAVAIFLCLVVWMVQMAADSLVAIVGLGLLLVTNVLAIGVIYGKVTTRLDYIEIGMSKVVTQDQLNSALGVLTNTLADKYQTKAGCEQLHNGVSKC